MQEQTKVQTIPVKVYRSEQRLMVAAPMPGLQPEDIVIELKSDGHLILQGVLRGVLKDVKELLIDEWSVGDYYRDVALLDNVDAEHANATYGNGVLVLAFPLSDQLVPAFITLEKIGTDRGEHMGNAGHIPRV
jgi:HSP20 family protein